MLPLPSWYINRTSVPHSVPRLGDLFRIPAENWPYRIAIADGKTSYTFSQLETGAEVLASQLRTLGVGSGDIVAVMAEKCAVVPMIAIAIWKCGGVYVPLDASQPETRLRKILARLAPAVVIALDDRPPQIDSDWLSGTALQEILAAPSAPSVSYPMEDEQPAYIIFTSGSTGEPKGVQISVRNLIAYFGNHNRVLKFGPSSRVFSLSPFHFDVSIEDTILPLSVGAFVYQYRGMHLGGMMRAVLMREKITHLIAVSTLLGLITEDGNHISRKSLPHMEMVITGAEVCDPEVINLWKDRLPDVRVLNAYGPTETTIVCLTHEIAAAEHGRKSAYPIGKPLCGVLIKLMDGDDETATPGQPGELWIGGEQVMSGYFDQIEETSRAIVIQDGVRFYRSGDICHFDANGNVVFVGRKDGEVKLAGRRIHLGEIHQIALGCPGVAGAAVTLVERYAKKAIGLVVTADSPDILSRVESHLTENLPAYMLPVVMAWSRTSVVTSTGKTDERVLAQWLQNAARRHDVRYLALHGDTEFEPLGEAIHER